MTALKPGWMDKEFKAAKEDMARWPRWMKLQTDLFHESIYLGFPCYTSPHHPGPQPNYLGSQWLEIMGIIAFDEKEAQEKMIEYLKKSRTAEGNWRIEKIRKIPKIAGVDVFVAAQVLAAAGLIMLRITGPNDKIILRITAPND